MILFKQTNITQDAYYEVMTRNDITIYSAFNRLLNSSCCFSLHSFFGFILFSWPSLPFTEQIYNFYLSYLIHSYFLQDFKRLSYIPLQINKTTLPRYYRFHSIRKIDGTLSFLHVHWREIPHVANYSPAGHHHI